MYLKAAEAAAGTDAELGQRIREAQMPLMYAFLVRWDELRAESEKAEADWPLSPDKKAVYDEFMGIAQEARVAKVSERNGLDWMKTALEQ